MVSEMQAEEATYHLTGHVDGNHALCPPRHTRLLMSRPVIVRGFEKQRIDLSGTQSDRLEEAFEVASFIFDFPSMVQNRMHPDLGASYGFDCPLNHIFWMAGPRARPQDGRTRWNQGPTTSQVGKHRGKRFSEVRAEDPDYLAWAKGQEAKLRKLFTARSDSIEHFEEAVRKAWAAAIEQQTFCLPGVAQTPDGVV